MDPDDRTAEPALEDLDVPESTAEESPAGAVAEGTAAVGPSVGGVTPPPGTLRSTATFGAEPIERPTDGRPGWALLAVLGILTVLLATVVIHADIDAIADAGWQENALWAAGAAVVLLGIALAATAWTVSTPQSGSWLTRVAVLAAVFGVVGAIVVVGLADDRGGETARAQGAPVSLAAAEAAQPEEPVLGVADALDPAYLAPSSLPIDVRQVVTLELTRVGQELLANAMGCRPSDLRNNGVIGSAIGGTWAQPLLVVSPPFDVEGESVERCRRIIIRLPIVAGVIRPGY